MSKGSKPRPLSVSREEFNDRWDNIFRKPKIPTPKGTPEQTYEHFKERFKTENPGTSVK